MKSEEDVSINLEIEIGGYRPVVYIMLNKDQARILAVYANEKSAKIDQANALECGDELVIERRVVNDLSRYF